MSQSGQFRDRVSFYRADEVTDTYGNVTTGWATPFLTVWADVLETLGRERVASGRVEAQRSLTVRIRYSAAAAQITEADRLEVFGERWTIVSKARVGRRNAVIEFLAIGPVKEDA